MRQTPNVLEVQERVLGRLSPCQVWWGSDFTRRRCGQKRLSFFLCLFVCLFACLFDTLLNVRDYAPDFRHRLLPIGDNTKCRSPKNAKNRVSSPTEGNGINRSRRNLARKRTPWVCYSTPHLALIGKRGSVQEPPKCQNLPKIVIFCHQKPTQ